MFCAIFNFQTRSSADPGIMGEGLMGKELSEKPDAIENLTEFLLSI